MKKTTFTICAILICALLFCGGCSEQTQPEKETVSLPSRFVVVPDNEFGYGSSVQRKPAGSELSPATDGDKTMHYVVDRETRVVYMYYSGDRGKFMVVLMNADGTPMIYDGELPYSAEDEIA